MIKRAYNKDLLLLYIKEIIKKVRKKPNQTIKHQGPMYVHLVLKHKIYEYCHTE